MESNKSKFSITLKYLYYLAVILTGIAAWISFYFAYLKPQSPFNPKVTFGNPVLKQVDGLVTVTLGIVASNVGGHSGCVADMALSLQSKAAKTRWAFMPTWFIEMRTFLRGLPEKKDIIPCINSSFSPFSLPADTTERYSVFFMPRAIEDPHLNPLHCTDLIAGDTYEFKLYIIAIGDDCVINEYNNWVLASKAEFVLKEEQLKGLREGLVVIPLDIARDVLRDKFLKH